MKLIAPFSLVLCGSIAFKSISADDTPVRCGIRKRFGVQLIHGGNTAELGQWPWHATLFHGPDFKCGATLIGKRHLLTTAFCVIKSKRTVKKPDTISIHLGKNVLDENPDEQVQIVNVSEIHVHPEFARKRHDIALLVLSQPVQYSEYVIPICIEGIQVAKGEDLVGQRGWVAGFGETEIGKISNQLKTISMPVVNKSECIQSDPELFGRLVSPAVFCAGDRNGTGICRGDGGSGLYILAGDHWDLRGIAYYSKLSDSGSCDTMSYFGFTNVAFFHEWIKRFISVEVDQEV